MSATKAYYLDPDALEELPNDPNAQDLLSDDPAYQEMSASIDMSANKDDPVLEGF